VSRSAQQSTGGPARPRLELSATQLAATALAAVTTTVAASFLGLSGTVIGAAVASVLSAIGNAVYAHSLRRTRDRVRRVALAPVRPAPAPGPAAGWSAPSVQGRPGRPARSGGWRRLALGSAVTFVAVLALVTGVELVAGRPLSDLLRGTSGSGTSLFGQTDQARAGTRPGGTTPQPVPTVTRTVVPSVVVTTPTVTQTAPAVTRTATPTAPPTATPSDSGRPDPSSSPAG
jgi:hypothetical protein